MTDQELLSGHLAGDVSAFPALVNRYLNMVHAAALRQAPDHANDITQTVFVLLHRKAGSLKHHLSIGGWLFNATRLCSAEIRRTEKRRRFHERAAAVSGQIGPIHPSGQASETTLLPLLDAALASLPASDRELVVQRHLQNRPLEELAADLRLSVPAVTKRVQRAVERLRTWFARNGQLLPAAAITALLVAQAAHRAPAALAVGTAATTLTAANLAKSVGLRLTVFSNKTAAVIIVLLLIILGTWIAVREQSSRVQSRPDLAAMPSAPRPASMKATESLTLKGHTSFVESVCFSPDGKQIASGSWDNTARLWDAATGAELLTLQGHTAGVNCVCFSPDGKQLATASLDHTVKIWEAATGKELRAFKGHSDQVFSVCFSPDGKLLASGSWDKTAKIWEAATGKELLTLAGHGYCVISVSFSPDGKRLASGSLDANAKVWDAVTGKELLLLEGQWGVMSVRFSPDGKCLASGSQDKSLTIWNATTGREELTLRGHSDRVTSVCFSPDGKCLASGSRDKTAKLWDASTGKELITLNGHGSDVNSVCFSPDGKHLATGSSDNTVKVWTVSEANPR